MPRTRLEQFPKKNREAIARWLEVHAEVDSNTRDIVEQSRDILCTNIAGLRSRPPRPGYAYGSEANLVASELGILASELTHRAIAKRLVSDCPDELAHGIYLASRLRYVANLAKTFKYSGSDCQHVFDMILSAAANDGNAVAAYLWRYDYTAKKGHPFAVLLCNAMRMILNSQSDDDLVAKLHRQKDTAYDKATLLALAAIAERNPESVTGNLLAMLSGHGRKESNNVMLQYFAMPVHAIFKVACDCFAVSGIASPVAPDSALWDAPAHARIHESPAVHDINVLVVLSPTILKWAVSLPESVPDHAFASLFAEGSVT